MLETTNLLWYSSIAVQFLFCVYLIWTKVARSYAVFAVCLGYSVLRDLAGIYFMRGAIGWRLPLSYTYFWLAAEPVFLLLQIGLVWEVHTKMWLHRRDILAQTRPLLIFALLMALTAAAIPVRAESLHPGASRLLLVLHFGIQATRYISSVLAIFLALSAVVYFIVIGHGLADTVIRHDGIMAAYFAIYAIAAFLIDAGWVRTTLVNGYFVSAITLCFVAWFSVFRPEPLPGK